MPRDYSRGKCDECKRRGRIWKFEQMDGQGFLWLCGKCQQEFRHARKVKRRSLKPWIDYE